MTNRTKHPPCPQAGVQWSAAGLQTGCAFRFGFEGGKGVECEGGATD